MLLTLLTFAGVGALLGTLSGAAVEGMDGVFLGGATGFVLGVVLWSVLWILYQRLVPAGLRDDDEQRAL